MGEGSASGVPWGEGLGKGGLESWGAQLKRGDRLVINGGSGNVGICATQLAKSIGAVVAVTAGSDEKA